jgi:hypothetical protein
MLLFFIVSLLVSLNAVVKKIGVFLAFAKYLYLSVVHYKNLILFFDYIISLSCAPTAKRLKNEIIGCIRGKTCFSDVFNEEPYALAAW